MSACEYRLFIHSVTMTFAISNLDPVKDAEQFRKTGVQIWRVENFKPVKIPDEFYGQFYVGDSYIVLSSIIEKDYKSMNLHFWLGKDSSQDEKGAAAALSARLDELLDDIPIQYREVEGGESARFLSYFPNGMQYLWGGVASGFNHVVDDTKTRLLHVKGKKKISATEVKVSWDSFNHGDIFVLEHKDQVINCLISILSL